MGRIIATRDESIGREVALKTLHQPDRAAATLSSDQAERFIREARVQGQLEHPAIVPVYEIGQLPDGAPYFTMKRVRGVSLADAIDRGRRGSADDRESLSRHRLLADFARLCLAVDFAHQRGVVHRDIKPANVMLGTHGEVYLLDWGVAKTGVGSSGATEESEARDSIEPGCDDASGKTRDGAVLGTPGYMPPEQATGTLLSVDGRADVYALGTILFEILAGEPMHRGSTLGELLRSTARGSDRSAAARAPDDDVPPELDALVELATRTNLEERLPSARALADGIEQFLEGKRDVAMREAAGARHAAEAATLAERAIADGSEKLRSDALREVGRALALDPDNTRARASLVQLLTEPPRALPKEVEGDLERVTRESSADSLRSITVAYASWLAFIPLVLVAGVAHWGYLAVTVTLFIATVGVAYRASRTPTPSHIYLALFVATLAIAAMALLFGPFVLVPTLAGANAVGYAVMPGAYRRHAVVAGAFAILCPLFLEHLSLLPVSTVFHEGSIELLPRLARFPGAATELALVVVTLAAVTIPAFSVAHARDALAKAERKLLVQSWQLKQLTS